MTTVKMVKLGTLIKPAKLQKCRNDDYPVLSMTMHNGLVFQSDKFKKSVASQDKSTYKVVHRNQLVIGFPIDEGVLATQRITDAGIVSPAYGIWDVDQTKIIPEFLEYALRCNRAIDYYKAKLRGSTARRRSLPTPTLLELDVPLPDIEQQKLALTTIHHAKNALDDRQAQLTKLDELVKARFVEMFGDLVENPKQFPCVLLGSIMTVMPQNGLYKPQSAYVQDKFGTPILRIDGFYNGKVTDFNNLKRLCCTDFEKERYLLVENDIVINRVNSIEYLGKCARISGLQEDTVFESNMMRFHLDDSKVNSTYITTVLCSQYIYRQILTRAKKAVNQASINQGDVQSLNVVVPPLPLQNQFADFVEEVDKSKVEVQKALDQTQLLFDSLMQQYFG